MRDIGANLASKQFQFDLCSVITRAKDAGVQFIDVTGTDLASSERAVSLAIEHAQYLGATAGIHPHGAKDCSPASLTRLRHLLSQPQTLMCGEMGLDYARNFSTPEQQRSAFEAQLDLAQEFDKPLFLHCREAFDEFVAIMDKRPHFWRKSIVHCFTGGLDQARALSERGAFIGLTGWITDKRRNADVVQAIKFYPRDKILIETDSPYLMPLNKPKSQTRERNEPAHVAWVARALASLLGCDAEEAMNVSYKNAEDLIGRPPALDQLLAHKPKGGAPSSH